MINDAIDASGGAFPPPWGITGVTGGALRRMNDPPKIAHKIFF
jgi:hypothetical protein